MATLFSRGCVWEDRTVDNNTALRKQGCPAAGTGMEEPRRAPYTRD